MRLGRDREYILRSRNDGFSCRSCASDSLPAVRRSFESDRPVTIVCVVGRYMIVLVRLLVDRADGRRPCAARASIGIVSSIERSAVLGLLERIERDHSVAASSLGRVHREISESFERLAVACVLPKYRQAYAGRRAQDGAFDAARLDDARQDLSGDARRGVRAAHVLEEDQELVAASASDRVRFTSARSQPRRDFAQELVSGGVTMLIIDRFEVIEVHEERRDVLFRSARPSQRMVQSVAP